jgi:hypothetical protein
MENPLYYIVREVPHFVLRSDLIGFVFLGKSARSNIKLDAAYSLNSVDCHILLSNLIQGAHQSDPENTKTIGLLCKASFFFKFVFNLEVA